MTRGKKTEDEVFMYHYVNNKIWNHSERINEQPFLNLLNYYTSICFFHLNLIRDVQNKSFGCDLLILEKV